MISLFIDRTLRSTFTGPHYNGYPAILVQLAKVGKSELRRLLTNAWPCAAPKGAVAAFKARKTRAALGAACGVARPFGCNRLIDTFSRSANSREVPKDIWL